MTLEQLKATSFCSVCGEYGHWGRDPICKGPPAKSAHEAANVNDGGDDDGHDDGKEDTSSCRHHSRSNGGNDGNDDHGHRQR